MDADGDIISRDDFLNGEIKNGLAQIQIVREGLLVISGRISCYELHVNKGNRVYESSPNNFPRLIHERNKHMISSGALHISANRFPLPFCETFQTAPQ